LMLVEQIGIVVFAAWWGFLDFYRTRLRQSRSLPKNALIKAWWNRSWVVAGILFFGTSALLLAFNKIEIPRYNVEALTAWTLMIKMSFDIPLIFLHSTSFAFRRVYFPLALILAGEILHFALVLGLIPLLGPWALFWGTLLTGVFQISTQTFFYYQSYCALKLPSLALRFSWRFLAQKRADPESWTGAALSALVACVSRAPLLIILALVFQFSSGNYLMPVFLCVPLFNFCGAWPRSFYVDFRKWSGEPWNLLMQITQQRILISVAALGGLAGITGSFVCFLFLDRTGLELFIPIFLAPILSVISYVSTLGLARFQSYLSFQWQGVNELSSVSNLGIYTRVLKKVKKPVRIFTVCAGSDRQILARIKKILLGLLDGRGILVPLSNSTFLVADWRETKNIQNSKDWQFFWLEQLQGYADQVTVLKLSSNGVDASEILDQPFFQPIYQRESKLSFVGLREFLNSQFVKEPLFRLRSRVLQGDKIRTSQGSLLPVLQDGILVGFDRRDDKLSR
jgi:hypothetical protein